VAALAFSPSGGNIASVLAAGSCANGVSVVVWAPPGLPGANPSRAALIAAGGARCVAWDSRSDKLMLIGCDRAGVRVWHADTRRVVASIPPEPGFGAVAALAACPSDPSFAVALNSSRGGAQQQGRVVLYNARSFKRSGVLGVPGDAALAWLAYSASGLQLAVGTATGAALLYEPGAGRTTPLRAWQVAAAVLPRLDAGSQAVQVLWRPSPPGAPAPVAESLLTLCGGVLCEWQLAPGSKQPAVALDVAGAAAQALGVARDAGAWHCAAAASAHGARVAVLCSTSDGGVLLVVTLLPPLRAQVVMQGPELAGAAGAVAWSAGGAALAVGSSGVPGLGGGAAATYLVRLAALMV
jgi:hypothetical protein